MVTDDLISDGLTVRKKKGKKERCSGSYRQDNLHLIQIKRNERRKRPPVSLSQSSNNVIRKEENSPKKNRINNSRLVLIPYLHSLLGLHSRCCKRNKKEKRKVLWRPNVDRKGKGLALTLQRFRK